MSKTVTLRLNDKVYKIFRTLAESDNRTLSNFIETSALRYIEEHGFVDDYEMEEIRSNQQLNKSLKRALTDAKARRGRFVK
jgi:predicted transcriptional regulator